jgi:hypothetical protein
MKTKTLLTAAALAAGALTAMAQSNVYSLNVVGYYNVPVLASSYYMAANQLDTGTNGLNQVLPNGGAGDQVLTFVNNNYNIDITDGTGNWFDNNTGNPTTTTVYPGKGFFYYNAGGSTETVTFVGQVRQGALATALPPGFALISTPVPAALGLNSNSFPLIAGAQVLTFVNNDYLIDITDGTQWYDNNTGNPVDLRPVVGQGYFYYNPASATTWTLNFTVQ